MTIEESIKTNPTQFEEIMDSKAPEIKAALIDLSAKLDVIINGAIKEYCAEPGAEVKMDAIPSYKAMTRSGSHCHSDCKIRCLNIHIA